jgi:FkbM family methyltransferase
VFVSYAQNLEDVVLWRVFQHVHKGTYVDVGAADPSEDSVTRAFYERGWSGLNIEPNPEFADRLRQERPRDAVVQACVGDSGDSSVILHVVVGTGLSTVRSDYAARITDPDLVVDSITVPNRRLDEILKSEGFTGRPIQFLKIDVEGAEQAVLASIDFGSWRPWVIVVEATEPRSTTVSFEAWEEVLLNANYTFCLFDGLNRFYVAKEHEELEADLSAPANFFDRPFLTAEESRNRSELERTTASWHQLNLEYLKTLEAYKNLETEHLLALSNHEKLEEVTRETLGAYHRLEVTYNETLAAYHRLEDAHNETTASDLHQELLPKRRGR